jgi:hypothetical protein
MNKKNRIDKMNKPEENLKDCGNSKKYRGLRPPRCNGGKGCDVCRKIFDERLNALVELIRKS